MNRMKSILLTATALATLGMAQQASAQTIDATGVIFLGPPPEASTNNDIFPDSIIVSQAITADGRTVLTSASTPSGSPNEAIRNLNQNIFLWTDGVMRTISVAHPAPAIGRGNGYFSTGMSGDGNTIIGSRAVIADRLGGGTSSYNAATIWTQATGLQFFASPSANAFVAFAQPNMDGSLIAVTARPTPLLADGSTNPARFGPRTVFRYSPTSGFQSLGSLGATISMTSQAISGAGDVIAGGSTDLAASNLDANGDPITNGAWRWTASSGLSVLADLSASPLGGTVGRNTSVLGISRDGSTIVGGSLGSDGRRQAVYWRDGSITGLGFLPGFPAPTTGDYGTNAIAASADGRVIVGAAGTGIGNFVGWHWAAATGMQDLNVLARNAGLNLNGFVLADATGISDNGQFITGNATKGGLDSLGLPLIGQGYTLSIAAAPPVPDPVMGVTFLAAPAGAASDYTHVIDITADGTAVVGEDETRLVVWENGAPRVVSTSPVTAIISASAISGDGRTISGFENERLRRSVFGSASGGFSYLPNPVSNELIRGDLYVNTNGNTFAATSVEFTTSGGNFMAITYLTNLRS